jgi:hypothetical protein
MKSFDPSEQEHLQNWRALQIELGLIPDETIVPVPESDAPPAEGHDEPEATSTTDPALSDATPVTTNQSEELAPAEYAVAASTEQDVEVGDAPEEIPDDPSEEPSSPEKKRRRRRRRRRRGDSPTDAATAESIETEANQESTASEDEVEGEVETESSNECEESDDDSRDDDDEEEVEPISLPDWNVPSWQELIDSLYRPER